MDEMCALIKRLEDEGPGKGIWSEPFLCSLIFYRKIESALEFNMNSLVSNLQLLDFFLNSCQINFFLIKLCNQTRCSKI